MFIKRLLRQTFVCCFRHPPTSCNQTYSVSLADSLKNKIIPEMKNKHLHVIYKKFPDEVHGTIALPAIFDGLKSLFHSTISTKEAT